MTYENHKNYPEFIQRLRKVLANGIWLESASPKLRFEIDKSVWSWSTESGFVYGERSGSTCLIRVSSADLIMVLKDKIDPHKLLQLGRLEIMGLHSDAIALSRLFFSPEAQKLKWVNFFSEEDLALTHFTSEGKRLILDEALSRLQKIEAERCTDLSRIRKALVNWAAHKLLYCDNNQWKRIDIEDLATQHWTQAPAIDGVVSLYFKELREEASQFLTGDIKAPHYGQSDVSADIPVGHQPQGWRSYNLIENYADRTSRQKRFPLTSKLLAEIKKTHSIVHAGFLILEGKVKIPTHSDGANWLLSYQYGLFVPDECYLEVCGDRRLHQEGKSIVFNDSYLHSAGNDSQNTRVLLVILYANPQLSDGEQFALKELVNIMPVDSLVYSK